MKYVWHVLCVGAIGSGACVVQPETNGSPARNFELRAYDARGREMPFDALPRRPEFVLSSARESSNSDELLLFAGAPDEELLEDLEGLPLRAAHDARRIACTAAVESNALRLVPRGALARGSTYTVALPGHGEEPAFVSEVLVSGDPGAGASWLGSLPAAGAFGVPPNLEAAWFALDGDLSGSEEGLWLEDPEQRDLSHGAVTVPCAELESRAATCVRLDLERGLAADADYTLRSGRALADAHGAPIETFSASFKTRAESDREPPSFEVLGCLRDERAVAVGCALVSEQAIRLRVRASEPIRLLARSGEQRAARLLAGGEGALDLEGLPRATLIDLELRAIDLAGNSVRAQLQLHTEAALAPVHITEVRADPAGPEPEQEYVEIASFATTSVALEGFSIVDAADARASTITRAVELPPGARALLVADGFDPADSLDQPPPPGTPLIRIGNTLTRAGLANSGEPLILRDAEGRRLSAVPTWAATGRGSCVHRLDGADPRSDAADAFRDGPCTPGR